MYTSRVLIARQAGRGCGGPGRLGRHDRPHHALPEGTPPQAATPMSDPILQAILGPLGVLAVFLLEAEAGRRGMWRWGRDYDAMVIEKDKMIAEKDKQIAAAIDDRNNWQSLYVTLMQGFQRQVEANAQISTAALNAHKGS